MSDPGGGGRGGGARACLAAALFSLLPVAACAKSEERWLDELSDPDLFVRGLAAIAISEIAPEQGPSALYVLTETLDSDKEILHPAARRALERVARESVPQLLAMICTDPNAVGELRAMLLRALSTAGAPAVEPLIAALREPGRSNGRELGKVLCKIGEPAIDPLVALMKSGPDRDRASGAWLLGEFGTQAERVLPDLLEAIDTAPPRVARAAIEAVWRVDLAAGRSLPHLSAALASDDRHVREAAARAIARIRLMQLGPLSPQPAREERAAAMRELLALGPPAWPVLIEAANGSDTRAARTAADGVGAVAHALALRALWLGPDAREAALPEPSLISEAVLDPMPDTRGMRVLELLRAGRHARGELSLLARAAADPHHGVRLCAAWARWSIVLDAARAGRADAPRR